jgi:hypothetical protein
MYLACKLGAWICTFVVSLKALLQNTFQILITARSVRSSIALSYGVSISVVQTLVSMDPAMQAFMEEQTSPRFFTIRLQGRYRPTVVLSDTTESQSPQNEPEEADDAMQEQVWDPDGSSVDSMTDSGPMGEALWMDEPLENFQIHTDKYTWLRATMRSAREAGSLSLLQVRHDHSQISPIIVFLMPCFDERTRTVGCDAVPSLPGCQKARLCPFFLLEMRQMVLKDGLITCCRCENPGCDRSPGARDHFCMEFQVPEQEHRSCEDLFRQEDTLCQCGWAALNAFWRHMGAADVMDPDSFSAWYMEQEEACAPLHLLRCLTCT